MDRFYAYNNATDHGTTNRFAMRLAPHKPWMKLSTMQLFSAQPPIVRRYLERALPAGTVVPQRIEMPREGTISWMLPDGPFETIRLRVDKVTPLPRGRKQERLHGGD